MLRAALEQGSDPEKAIASLRERNLSLQEERSRLLRGLGLPARGARPAGHLFVSLKPSEDAPSAAEDLLARFTRVWTPDRLAA